ncbi:Swt1 family HEPN domain-containing protein [Sorangium sp. So ce693]|uniref:Swt1 family HEPN domain-containing protein n=1 Tax=Sorangium sp. So ce693 TaxID=3133318 RepID=UPI003F5FE3C1
MMSTRDRVRKALDHVREGLRPFVEREMRSKLGTKWQDEARYRLSLQTGRDGSPNWDTQALLKAIGHEFWNDVFKSSLQQVDRNYAIELKDVRNKHAHDEAFTNDDAYRSIDTAQRLLEAIHASAQAEECGKLKRELQQVVLAEHKSIEATSPLAIEMATKAGLKPWREIVTPHRDVASGRYMQAEFAADLAQVHRGEGSEEYREPVEFFRRTYLTAGLKDLLVGALQRIAGTGGDPVVELQTNFGGGKTHSMLALFHLFGAPKGKLPGVDEVLAEAKLKDLPRARRAVLVGTALSPSEESKKPDGVVVRTIWGELAWQLGNAAGGKGKEAYKLVAESDAKATSPGSKVLVDLFRKYGPALVLIDEWVAYARQVVGKRDLPSGDFEAQTSFAQALTEAAKAAEKTLVVASIPASKIEIGGENGELALETLKNVFTRVGKPWRPASADEGFEIVRRRLFEPIEGKENITAREAVVRAFVKMYKDSADDFPLGCGEKAYERDLTNAYPIHPELFRRLYDDWSTLDKFQRTRGVLRLLAKVVHRLWESQDASLMIMPSSVPIYDGAVRSELTRYLPDVWEPIISQDVDGEHSLPLELDRASPNLGKVSACRRVARTLYMGTAPGADHKNPGIDDRRVRLGCVQPGEAIATFGDALRRISDRAKYIHQDGNRYWISTKANLNRLAEDRASTNLRDPETLYAEIVSRIQRDAKKRGLFAAVHTCPETSADVADESSARLVILSPKQPHKKGQTGKDDASAAVATARSILESKGTGPRLERNCLLFLAPDLKDLDGVLNAAAHYLAWKSIQNEATPLNLDKFQENQVATKVKEFDSTIDVRLQATYAWGLAPRQADPTSEIEWEDFKVREGGSLAERASACFEKEWVLRTKLNGVELRGLLDKHLWAERDHVTVGQLAEWFARYLYLPRITNRAVLETAVQDGASVIAADDTFAVAAAFDEGKKRYSGLRVAEGAVAVVDRTTLVVKPAVARAQREREQGPSATGGRHDSGQAPEPGDGAPLSPKMPVPPAPKLPPNAFVGSVKIDPTRVVKDAGRVVVEVLEHLSTLPDAEVEVTLEMRVRVPEGIKEAAVRTVSENTKTLKFQTAAFERE